MAGRRKHSQGLDASRPFLSTIELHVSNLKQGQSAQEKSRLAHIASKASINDLNRPLAKLDIFYSGSSTSLTNRQNSYGRRTGKGSLMASNDEPEAVQRKTSILLSALALPTTDESPKGIASYFFGRQLTNSLRSLVDLELLRSPSFIVLAVSGFLTLSCFFVPFIFIGALARQKGVEPALTKYLLMLLGAVNLSARVISGLIADHIDPLLLSNWAIILGGIATMAAPLLTEFWMFAVFHCVPFAAGVACFAALRSIICVELLGIEKLTNAYGMLMLFMGVAALFGPPFAATLKNLTNSFDMSFYVMGALMVLSGVLSLPLRRINKWEVEREQASNLELEPLNDESFVKNS